MTSKMKVTRRLRRRFGRLCASKVPDDGRPHDDDAKGDEPRTPHQMLEMGEIVSEGVAEGAIEHRPDERTERVPEEEYPKGHVGDAGEQPGKEADDRDEAGDEHRFRTVFGEEFAPLGNALLGEPDVTPVLRQEGESALSADQVS